MTFFCSLYSVNCYSWQGNSLSNQTLASNCSPCFSFLIKLSKLARKFIRMLPYLGYKQKFLCCSYETTFNKSQRDSTVNKLQQLTVFWTLQLLVPWNVPVVFFIDVLRGLGTGALGFELNLTQFPNHVIAMSGDTHWTFLKSGKAVQLDHFIPIQGSQRDKPDISLLSQQKCWCSQILLRSWNFQVMGYFSWNGC